MRSSASIEVSLQCISVNAALSCASRSNATDVFQSKIVINIKAKTRLVCCSTCMLMSTCWVKDWQSFQLYQSKCVVHVSKLLNCVFISLAFLSLVCQILKNTPKFVQVGGAQVSEKPAETVLHWHLRVFKASATEDGFGICVCFYILICFSVLWSCVI